MSGSEIEAALSEEPEDELVSLERDEGERKKRTGWGRSVAIVLSGVLGSIPLSPGGVDFVELDPTGALVGFGASNSEAVAATLIYRFLTTIPTIVLGLLTAGTWKVGRRPAAAVVGPGGLALVPRPW